MHGETIKLQDQMLVHSKLEYCLHCSQTQLRRKLLFVSHLELQPYYTAKLRN